jgi:hypothetical protein
MGAKGAKGARSAKGAMSAKSAKSAKSAMSAMSAKALGAGRRIGLIRNVPMLVADHSPNSIVCETAPIVPNV